MLFSKSKYIVSDYYSPQTDLYTPLSPRVSWYIQGNNESWKQKEEDASPFNLIAIIRQDHFKWQSCLKLQEVWSIMCYSFIELNITSLLLIFLKQQKCGSTMGVWLWPHKFDSITLCRQRGASASLFQNLLVTCEVKAWVLMFERGD